MRTPSSTRRCRLALLLVLLAGLAMPGCGKDDGASPTGPSTPAPPLRVLVLSDRGTEEQVGMVLGEAGHDTTMGGFWADEIEVDLEEFDVVVLLTGYDYYHQMTDADQSRLVDYVASGGGLVTTEWLAYYATLNPLLSAILPTLPTDDYAYATETYRPVAEHPIADGLPTAFITGPDWSWITLVPDTTAAKEVEVAVMGARGGPAVVTGIHGAGRVVSWGMAGVYSGDDIWTRGVEALLLSLVRYAGS
jgi:hypothetical protein